MALNIETHGGYIRCQCFKRDGWPVKVAATTVGDHFFRDGTEVRPVHFKVKPPSDAGWITVECAYCGHRYRFKVSNATQ